MRSLPVALAVAGAVWAAFADSSAQASLGSVAVLLVACAGVATAVGARDVAGALGASAAYAIVSLAVGASLRGAFASTHTPAGRLLLLAALVLVLLVALRIAVSMHASRVVRAVQRPTARARAVVVEPEEWQPVRAHEPADRANEEPDSQDDELGFFGGERDDG